MPEARDYYGKVFQNGSGVFLARLVGPSGEVLTPGDVSSIAYSIDLLDPRDPDARTPVEGHQQATVTAGDVLFDMLQRDAVWTRDSVGYNFRHEPDVSQHEAFAAAGRTYLVTYTVLPAAGQRILMRFRVQAI
jgi:hypothetical protein